MTQVMKDAMNLLREVADALLVENCPEKQEILGTIDRILNTPDPEEAE